VPRRAGFLIGRKEIPNDPWTKKAPRQLEAFRKRLKAGEVALPSGKPRSESIPRSRKTPVRMELPPDPRSIQQRMIDQQRRLKGVSRKRQT
jgi:hypothetical protein